MKFKKEELGFLSLFSVYTDNSINGDKIRISVEKDKIYFYQSSISTKVIYEIENVDNDPEEEYVLVTSQFLALIKLCKNDSVIEIKDGCNVQENCTIHMFPGVDPRIYPARSWEHRHPYDLPCSMKRRIPFHLA